MLFYRENIKFNNRRENKCLVVWFAYIILWGILVLGSHRKVITHVSRGSFSNEYIYRTFSSRVVVDVHIERIHSVFVYHNIISTRYIQLMSLRVYICPELYRLFKNKRITKTNIKTKYASKFHHGTGLRLKILREL